MFIPMFTTAWHEKSYTCTIDKLIFNPSLGANLGSTKPPKKSIRLDGGGTTLNYVIPV